MHDNQVQYNIMCNESGGVVDDLLVYRYSRTKYLLVVNAANTDKDVAWFRAHLPSDGVSMEDISPRTAEVALQGPEAEAILKKIADFDPASLKFFYFRDGATVGGIPAIVSRTGYTGEDGFEIYVDWKRGAELWDAVMKAGEGHGLLPTGLGARDSLRFEAGLPLYGHEYTDDMGPLEAGYGFFVKLDKPGGFIGRDALKRQKDDGLKHRIVATRLEDKGVPRQGMPVADEAGRVLGHVTSGGYSPTLDANIASCYVATPAPSEGESLWIDIRGKLKRAVVIKRPYYARGK